MKSLFETEVLEEINKRINTLSETTENEWGKMNVGQMTKHCQVPFEVINGNIKPSFKVGFFQKLLFSLMKPMMYNDRLWKKNVRTGKEFIIDYEVDFNQEKTKLLSMLNQFHERKNQEHWDPHPVFGNFKKEQWGKMQYKHLDHHLRQFGV